jgi:hypothetical protein
MDGGERDGNNEREREKIEGRRFREKVVNQGIGL